VCTYVSLSIILKSLKDNAHDRVDGEEFSIAYTEPDGLLATHSITDS